MGFFSLPSEEEDEAPFAIKANNKQIPPATLRASCLFLSTTALMREIVIVMSTWDSPHAGVTKVCYKDRAWVLGTEALGPSTGSATEKLCAPEQIAWPP